MDSTRRSLPEKICVVKLYYKYGNYAEVSRQWKNHFDSIPPTRKTMADIISRFEDTGSVAERLRPGRPKSATSGDQKAAISAAVSRSPQKSTRRASLQLGIPHTSVWRLYKELNLKPFRPRLIHGLSDDDFDRRVQFCQTFMNMVESSALDLDRILWTDEAVFKINGHVNRHNCVYWSEDNPHVTINKEVNAPGVCVWAGICSQGIVGPFFFDGNVNKTSYLELLSVKVYPQIATEDLVFMHDGAPAHYATEVRAWLDEKFPNRWIGRRGAIEWPARSPDLTPPDFFLWGVLKEDVYGSRAKDIQELMDRIKSAFSKIPVDLCAKVCRSVPSRLEKCIQLGGAQTELF